MSLNLYHRRRLNQVVFDIVDERRRQRETRKKQDEVRSVQARSACLSFMRCGFSKINLGLSSGPDLPSQSSFTGGGMGVDTVAMDTSPMIRSASLHAWYMRSISSRLTASSALSSIIEFCVPNRSQITNSVDSFSGRDLALTRAPARGHANTNTQRSGMKQGHKSSA